MSIDINGLALQVSATQALAIFWAVVVMASFNGAYLLCVMDRRRSTPVSSPHKAMVVVLGSLVVVSTYGEALAAKPFAMRDCLLLAFVFAHGWQAEDLVQGFLANAAKKFTHGPPPPVEPAGGQ